MKIAFFEVQTEEKRKLKKLLKNSKIKIFFFKESLDEKFLKQLKDKNFDIISVFVGSEINKNVLDNLKKTKLIITRSVGYNHIDIEHACKKGIPVCNIPCYGPHTVAEFTFGLILSLTRKIFDAYHQLREGLEFKDFQNLKGIEIFGKKLGVLGTGRIGKNVIKIAKGFGMEIIAYDPYPDKEFSQQEGFKYVSFDQVIKESDILTIHAPLTKENYHLINKKNIFKMKKGAYLINTARGELIDTDALFEAIYKKHLAGAALDVLEIEKKLKEEILSGKTTLTCPDYKKILENLILIDLPQVIITPHIAFYTQEAEEEIIKTTAQIITEYLKNKKLINKVN